MPVKFWAQYWPSWLLRTLRKFEKNHHHLLRITTFFITDCGILQVTWPLMSNQKLKQQNKTICFSFWLVRSGHVTCRMWQSVIKKVVILNKWWWFFSNFLRVLSNQEGQYWAKNFTGHLLITYSMFLRVSKVLPKVPKGLLRVPKVFLKVSIIVPKSS